MYFFFLFSSFEDPGPHGNGRYSEHMLPEIEMKDFRKGAQVQHISLSSIISLYKLCSISMLFLSIIFADKM